MERPTVLIVGANLAGGRAAEALRAEGYDGRIVLIGEEPYRPYERPPLSKEVLRGEWPLDKAYLRPEQWYADNDVEMVLGARVTMIDVAERAVLAAGRLMDFHRLLLATGGRPKSLPIPGIELDGVRTLRTIDDSLAIGEAIRAGARLAIIGAGFIGCEVAASARALGAEVHLVDVLATPMVRALGEEIGAVFAQIHADHGVHIHLGTGIERIEGDGRAERVVLAGGATIDADLVVVGVGLEPADELAREAGLACDDGIIVNERCETTAPGIFAAGDVARHPNPILGETIRIEHWQNAQNQGAAAARAMLHADARFAEVPWFWSDQYDVNLQMAGHPTGYDRIVYRGERASRAFAAFFMRGERILACAGLGKAKDVRGARALIEAGVSVDDATLADEGVDLRALARSLAG